MLEAAQRPSRMTVDLQGYKKPWIEWCKARGTTPSEAFRQIAAKLMSKGEGGGLDGEATAGEDFDEKVRVRIRLTSAEFSEAQSMAINEGFTLPRWIVSLIRGRLGKGAQLGEAEMEALARSNLQLMAVGRNLNQIAKALNTSSGDRKLYRLDLLEALEAEVRTNAKAVAAVMAANVDRWKLK